MQLTKLSFCRLFSCAFLITCAFCVSGQAQEDPPDVAPPPLKIVSREDQAKLDAEKDIKERTKLALELMRSRLDEAEKLNTAEDFDGLFTQLGRFRGLVDHAFDFLDEPGIKESKRLDNYKRLEISLRRFIPRLETIRRELPLRYEQYVHDLIRFLRNARTKAVEPMFSNTVVPSRKPD